MPNAYQRRQAARKAAAAMRRAKHKRERDEAVQSQIDQENQRAAVVADEYEKAMDEVRGVKVICKIHDAGLINAQGETFTADELRRKVDVLWAEQHQRELDAPD